VSQAVRVLSFKLHTNDSGGTQWNESLQASKLVVTSVEGNLEGGVIRECDRGEMVDCTISCTSLALLQSWSKQHLRRTWAGPNQRTRLNASGTCHVSRARLSSPPQRSAPSLPAPSPFAMFNLIRRISGSVLPRPDRSWNDDRESNKCISESP
jgi:hypothetical protein